MIEARTVFNLASAMMDAAPCQTLAETVAYVLGMTEGEAKELARHAVIAGADAAHAAHPDGDLDNDRSLIYIVAVALVFGAAAESCQLPVPRVRAAR